MEDVVEFATDDRVEDRNGLVGCDLYWAEQCDCTFNLIGDEFNIVCPIQVKRDVKAQVFNRCGCRNKGDNLSSVKKR